LTKFQIILIRELTEFAQFTIPRFSLLTLELTFSMAVFGMASFIRYNNAKLLLSWYFYAILLIRFWRF